MQISDRPEALPVLADRIKRAASDLNAAAKEAAGAGLVVTLSVTQCVDVVVGPFGDAVMANAPVRPVVTVKVAKEEVL